MFPFGVVGHPSAEISPTAILDERVRERERERENETERGREGFNRQRIGRAGEREHVERIRPVERELLLIAATTRFKRVLNVYRTSPKRV